MLEFAMQTSIGSRPSNQDRMFAAADGTSGIFCVADGMGGLKNGHIAAEIAADGVAGWWEKRTQAPEFHGLFESIHKEITARAGDEKNPLGTTLSLLFICNGSYHIAHTGDSRIYLARKRLFRTALTQLTEDHTVAADKLREGVPLSKIQENPQKNALTGCLGCVETPRVFTTTGHVDKNMTFLLCSDGLYRVATRKTLAKTIAKNQNPAALATRLISLAETRGTKDNASVVVVHYL